MPYALGTHVLTVDANVIHKVDTANPYNLISMWTVFSRCAESVEQGRRLENLSWRLWNSQTSRQGTKSRSTSTASSVRPKEITEIVDQVVPPLSVSVDSAPDDEALEFVSGSSLPDIRPRIRREDSCASRRDRIKDEFEKMVVSIITSKKLDAAPRKETIDQSTFERSGSTTDESPSKSSEEPSETSQQSPEMTSHTTVIRGFSPSSTISRSASQRSSPESPDIRVPQRLAVTKKPPPTFRFVSSCSSSEQNQSVDGRKPVQKPARRGVFQVGPAGSSDEESSIRSALHSPPQGPQLHAQKKHTSFSNQVTVAEAAVDDSETEADDVDESAIDDDDDSSEWEDSVEDSDKSSIDEKTYFQRVDSSANLASRRSLLTLMLEQNSDRTKLANGASQSTSAISRQRGNTKGPSLGASPNDSDDTPLMMKQGSRSTTLKPINEVPRSAAQPIVTTNNHGHFQAALSPRTTRRNMLATELTESLRRHLLWERQQKSSTANAVLKRRHTSHDVANLKQYPERPYMNKNEDANASSWNQVFAKEAFGDYNSQGW